MTKNKSQILISLVLIILLAFLPVTCNAGSNGAEPFPESSLLIKESETVIAGEKVKTQTYISNGETVVAATYDEGDTYSKDKVITEKLKQYKSRESISSGVSVYGAGSWGKNRLYNFTGVASNNKQVKINCAINANTVGKQPYGSTIHVWGGHTYGMYNGTNPYNADQMRLTQEYGVTATTANVNMSVPGGVSVSGGKMSKVAKWTSAPIRNTWYMEATHKNITANCFSIPGTMKITLEDSAEVYLRSNVYRAYAKLSKTWNNIYYG